MKYLFLLLAVVFYFGCSKDSPIAPTIESPTAHHGERILKSSLIVDSTGKHLYKIYYNLNIKFDSAIILDSDNINYGEKYLTIPAFYLDMAGYNFFIYDSGSFNFLSSFRSDTTIYRNYDAMQVDRKFAYKYLYVDDRLIAWISYIYDRRLPDTTFNLFAIENRAYRYDKFGYPCYYSYRQSVTPSDTVLEILCKDSIINFY